MPPQSSINTPVATAPPTSFPIFHALIILAIFLIYGSSVRKGVVRGKGILWLGVLVGAMATGLYALDMLPLYQRGEPLGMVALPPLIMAGLSVFCVVMSYQQQRVRDVATLMAGNTRIIIRACPAITITDAGALLLPVSTALRANDRTARAVLDAAGPQVGDALAKQGPVGMGKVVPTVGGALAIKQIFHAAVADAGRPVDAARLRRGLESGAQQARKAGAASLVVPLGPLLGLSLQDSLAIPIDAVLKQRKAFREVVFVVFEPRLASLAQTVVTQTLAPDVPAKPEIAAS